MINENIHFLNRYLLFTLYSFFASVYVFNTNFVLNNIKWNSTNSISLIFSSFCLSVAISFYPAHFVFFFHSFLLPKNRFCFRKPHSIKIKKNPHCTENEKKMYFKYPEFFLFDNCALTNRFNEVCTRKPLTIHRRCFVKCFPNWIKNLTKPSQHRWNCEFIKKKEEQQKKVQK